MGIALAFWCIGSGKFGLLARTLCISNILSDKFMYWPLRCLQPTTLRKTEIAVCYYPVTRECVIRCNFCSGLQWKHILYIFRFSCVDVSCEVKTGNLMTAFFLSHAMRWCVEYLLRLVCSVHSMHTMKPWHKHKGGRMSYVIGDWTRLS